MGAVALRFGGLSSLRCGRPDALGGRGQMIGGLAHRGDHVLQAALHLVYDAGEFAEFVARMYGKVVSRKVAGGNAGSASDHGRKTNVEAAANE